MIIVDLAIICVNDENPNGYVYSMMRKEYNTNLVPIAGMEFEDPAWKNPRVIQNVTLIPEENCYLLWLGDDRDIGVERCEQKTHMYKLHHWQKL